MLKKSGYLVGYFALAFICSCSFLSPFMLSAGKTIPVKKTDSVAFIFDGNHVLDTIKIIPNAGEIPPLKP